ncbi:MAG TPA: xanthine dehydrogenase family protein subunit M [Chloroflexota bacterium]|nr:xanthine dehydrogenase family protein subunit M [Chloroflexota bacterium]
MYKFDFIAPQTAAEAVAELQNRGPGGKLLAGGTDLLLQIKARVMKPAYVVDLSRVGELAQIEDRSGEGVFVGSMVRLRTIQLSPVLAERSPILVDGAKLVGSIQIRNLATLGGNLCNAAPSADVSPPLIVAGARAEILGPAGRRSVSLDDFFLGPRRTVLGPDEVLLGVLIPRAPRRSGGSYLRHTPRKEMDIAVVGVGSAVTLDDGYCTAARIALGAVAPTPIRSVKAESVLVGQRLSTELITRAAETAAEDARPISDVRGSAEFRRHLVAELAKRTLTTAWAQAQGEEA